MRVTLISIGHCPSLATRNLRAYCLAHDDVRDRVTFDVIDEDLREFTAARIDSVQHWSFTTVRDRLLKRLVDAPPDLVGFSCYLWNTDLSLEMAQTIKRLLPNARIVLGGPDAGPRARELLDRHRDVDAIIEGDGENPFLAIVRQLLGDDPHPFWSIAGVAHRTEGGLVRQAPQAGLADLSLLRDVWFDLPSQAALDRWGWPHLLYETMRGCPYACSYCMYGKVPANRRVETLVVDELAAILAKGVDVEIIDPTFTTYVKRAREILRGLSERTLSGSLYFEAYPDSIDEEMIALLKATRVACIGLGFQTISKEGLDAVDRPQNLKKFERATSLLRAGGVRFYVDVIYGLPGTTRDDFFATMDYLFEHGMTEIVVYRLLGLPGSPMMDTAGDYGLTFSTHAPYELLKSKTFSLDDVLLCERYHATYQRLRLLGDELLRRFVTICGSLSTLVRRVMDAGALEASDARALERALASIMME